ncbi:MAG: bifunctional 3-phosphoshikimate 1-carboxyvinyltransferase/cytidylate kinase [Betaproteobacteria bacterium]|nr:bifunctional 3-phosphoshikimate 1-carboxyvinyltransferase/cytidylate kinase [Betaproteobacteria bacterium]
MSAGGTVRLPGSKSISNRVLLLAGLSAGTTRVLDVLESDDTRVMLDALRALGCTIESDGEAALRITGLGGQLKTRQAQLFLGNAGTAMRPLTAALALLAASQGGVFELSGIARMHERPIGDLINALRPLGCTIECLGTEGYPPLRLSGSALDLRAPIRVRGDVSSQFLTALLLALPLVARDQALTIEVTGELISKPYIEITLNLLARFGIAVQREGWARFTIPQGSHYQSPGEIPVEGDASSASYFIAVGALAATHTPLRIEGVGAASIQGDIRFVDAAQAMGAQISSGPNWLEIRRGAWPLHAIELDCNHIPDAAMTLAVMALYARGTTKLSNIASWRVKETDRIAAMATELRKLGAEVEEGADYIRVTPAALHPAAIDTYDDHRMAMCFSLAAFGTPLRINDPKCVAKTFPDYFERFAAVTRAAPVIAIDGPSASGKGTVAARVAEALGFSYLDSGALYRLTALAAKQAGVDWADESEVAKLAAVLDVEFSGTDIRLNGTLVGDAIRTEEMSAGASKVATLPAVREALLFRQRAFNTLPGLVGDGRDMGSVIFPKAVLKVFLTASAEARAKRRYKQLIEKGFSANLADLLADLQQRDARDSQRSVAPLRQEADARLLDTTHLTIEQAVNQVLAWSREVSL